MVKPEQSEAWLLNSCSAEIRVHRAFFAFALVPILGLWLPGLMIYLGLAFAGTALSLSLPISASPLIAAGLVLIAMHSGYARERKSLKESDDRLIASQIELGAVEQARAEAKLLEVWQGLETAAGSPPPGIICRPHFGILAHAYDADGERLIEVSAGLLTRLLRDDPMAMVILRHELAHLVYHDLPVMRRHNELLGGATMVFMAAAAVCGLAVLLVALAGLAEGMKSSQPLTFVVVLKGLLAVIAFAATIVIAIPVGLYALKRYAGFIVALMELRADVGAGVWGGKLETFSHQLDRDGGVRATTFWDYGRAYVSATLSHFPAKERSRLLADKERLATPKMRYFAVAILATWLLGFHQGTILLGWDFALLAIAVSVLYGITLYMILNACGHAQLTPARSLDLALALWAAQLLPCLSLEGFAYLAQHLSFAIAVPGGFGGESTVSYGEDIAVTVKEFLRKTMAAAGGKAAWIPVAAIAAAIFVLSRLPRAMRDTTNRWVVLTASASSIVVTYGFFQSSLYRSLRDLSFQLSSSRLYEISEYLHAPLLNDLPWIKLAVPMLCALLVAGGLRLLDVWSGKTATPFDRLEDKSRRRAD